MRRHWPCCVRGRQLVALQMKALSEAELEISDTAACGKKNPIAEHLIVKILIQQSLFECFYLESLVSYCRFLESGKLSEQCVLDNINLEKKKSVITGNMLPNSEVKSCFVYMVH